jgi:hypothetical protein
MGITPDCAGSCDQRRRGLQLGLLLNEREVGVVKHDVILPVPICSRKR